MKEPATEKSKEKITFRLVGFEKEQIEFSGEILNLFRYMKRNKWKLIFEKTKDNGWFIEFKK